MIISLTMCLAYRKIKHMFHEFTSLHFLIIIEIIAPGCTRNFTKAKCYIS